MTRPRRASVNLVGVRVPLRDPNIVGPVREAIIDGHYELDDARALRALAEPGDIILEIGSGIGFISALAAKLTSSEQVFTYEANPDLRATILRLHNLNGVSPHLTIGPVGAENGYVRISAGQLFWDTRVKSSGETAVRAFSFVDIASRIQPTLLLLDCEGSEQEILTTAALPQSIRKLILELHPAMIGEENCERILTTLETQGFRPRIDLSNNYLRAMTRP